MKRRTALWISGGVALALLVVLGLLDAEMREAGGPGIVGFELAAGEERAGEILADWGDEGRDAARLSLLLDFPYLIAYGAFLALAAAAIRDRARARGWSRLAAAGAVAPMLPLTAALFDAVENAGLLFALERGGGEVAPLVATIFAAGKFILLGLTAAYLLAGLAASLLARRAASP